MLKIYYKDHQTTSQRKPKTNISKTDHLALHSEPECVAGDPLRMLINPGKMGGFLRMKYR